jgi:PQQ-dependent dehydrogenase (methanol/ethanol family)
MYLDYKARIAHPCALAGLVCEGICLFQELLCSRSLAVAASLLCAGTTFALEAAQSASPADSEAQQIQRQFGQSRAVCHGDRFEGSDRGPALVNNRRLRRIPEADLVSLIKNGVGGMPGFALPQAQLQALAGFIRSLNSTAFESQPAGDVAAGEQVFFGSGQCANCHTAKGRGKANGPDLSEIARQLTLAELDRALREPSARIAPGYGTVGVRLRNGSTLRGFARSQGTHNLQLQTPDGKLHLLLDTEYTNVTADKQSAMPPFKGSPAEMRNLTAFLSRLGGVALGPAPSAAEPVSAAAIEQILHPKAGDWPSYNGDMSGNRHSPLKQIDTQNVSRLHLEWSYTIPYFGLETTPLAIDGVMYVTGANQVSSIDGRTGREIWKYSRPRTPGGTIAADAAKGVNRGVAILGDRVFYITDNAHMICLHRLTGALLWDVFMGEQPQHYGGTSAPLVVGDLVIGGVAGADEGIRGFIAAYKATTGELAWRFWTVPRPGEPGFETWKGKAYEFGGGSSWLTGSYDSEAGVLYWSTGNPYPDTDGDERIGDNLYTNCDLALDPKTGKLLWHFQYTPHDLHDWDANQPIVLVNAPFHGRERKLLLHANRNGFFYVLDRTNGELLLAKPFVRKVTWASGIGADGRPQLLPANETNAQGVKTCPAVRGATNWYSSAYNPATHLYYVMAVEDCGVYRKAQNGGFGRVDDPSDPAMKYLRALEIETGKAAWELPLAGAVEANYSGVLSTAGGLIFFGESSGGFAAADATTGKYLWHFEANQPWKASPMTYTVNGRQYIAIASGANILSFAVAER